VGKLQFPYRFCSFVSASSTGSPASWSQPLASERRLGYCYTSKHRSDWRDHFSAVSRRPRTVALANREDAIQPANAKRSDVKCILRTAAEHFDVLVAAWEKMHP
jgi:hypothetical protein